jgi:hypothetical protein
VHVHCSRFLLNRHSDGLYIAVFESDFDFAFAFFGSGFDFDFVFAFCDFELEILCLLIKRHRLYGNIRKSR